MSSVKNTGRIVGALFVAVMVTWSIGYALIESVLSAEDYINNIYPNKTKVIIGVLFEMIEVTAVIGIATLMFPIFKKQNESVALVYVSLRILESSLLIMSAIAPLLLLTLSQGYLEVVALDNSCYETLGELLIAIRAQGTSLILSILYGFGALIFFSLLYRSKLIPRFISVWGLIAVPLMLLDEVLFGISGNYVLVINALPIAGLHLGLIEIFMGIWLIVKGFNSPA